MSLRSLLRLLVLAAAGFGASGCPAVLNDDFSTAPVGEAGGADAGKAGSAGMPSAQAGAADGGYAGLPEQGGSSLTGGIAGHGGMTTGGTDTAGLAGEGGVGGANDVCARCLATETCCDGVCADLRFDSNNCRTCGHGCPGTTCDNSSCTNTCAQGSIDCNHNVVDGCEVNPAVDPKNCGNCGITCGFELECIEGSCVCPAGTADCDGVKANGCETDTSSDKASCGGCGKACSANEACSGGSCSCGVGFLECNQLLTDGCEAAVTANDSCGSCGLDCGAHGLCVADGQCGCAPGYLDCDNSVPGCETPASDPGHCGACNVACPANMPACDGVKCSLGCGSLTTCGASCIDTKQDPENCGACGKAVGLNQVCMAGMPTCVVGFADCDGNPVDCEVNIQIDAAHCGGCNTVCKSGAQCNAGACACAPTTPNDCGAACQQCCSNAQCSDGDSCSADTCNGGVCTFGGQCATGGSCCSGTGCFTCCSDGDCTGGKVCSGNQCITLMCPAPQIACNSKCINPTTDATNCGGCGNQCGPGRGCSGSACTPKWLATAPPLLGFVAREKAAYAAIGSKVFVWGGSDATTKNLGDGAIYDPASDSWSAVAAAGSPPSARVLASAVWTGSVVVVWGGGDASGATNPSSGSRYDPASNSWQAMTLQGAPLGRRAAYGFWTGSRVLFFGGIDKSGSPLGGTDLYDPVNDVWSTANTNGQPTPRVDPTVGWSGSLLLVFGGRFQNNTASQSTYTYDVAANAWDNVADGPSQRSGALGVWDGTFLLTWSGTYLGLKTDGRLYEPNGDRWSAMQSSGDPDPRSAPNRQTGWSARIKPRVTLMLGGFGGSTNNFLTDGGIYNSTTNAWSSVAAWPSGASHLWGVGVWTGTEFVLWGGRSGTTSALTSTGERYLP
jgi:Galactose oxidase, central domain